MPSDAIRRAFLAEPFVGNTEFLLDCIDYADSTIDRLLVEQDRHAYALVTATTAAGAARDELDALRSQRTAAERVCQAWKVIRSRGTGWEELEKHGNPYPKILIDAWIRENQECEDAWQAWVAIVDGPVTDSH